MSFGGIRLQADRCLEVLDRLADLPAFQKHRSEIQPRFRESGIDLNRFSIRGERLVAPADRGKRVSQVQLSDRIVGLELQRARVRFNRLVRLSLRFEHISEIVVPVGDLRRDRDGLRNEIRRVVQFVNLVRQHAQKLKCVGMSGMSLKNLPIHRLRFGKISALMLLQSSAKRLLNSGINGHKRDFNRNSYDIRLRRGGVRGMRLA